MAGGVLVEREREQERALERDCVCVWKRGREGGREGVYVSVTE